MNYSQKALLSCSSVLACGYLCWLAFVSCKGTPPERLIQIQMVNPYLLPIDPPAFMSEPDAGKTGVYQVTDLIRFA